MPDFALISNVIFQFYMTKRTGLQATEFLHIHLQFYMSSLLGKKALMKC